MRIAILSDIHEDYGRLKRVMNKIDRKGYDICVCLGDISGYSDYYYYYRKKRNASACLELIRERCDIIIPGNHDLHAAGKIPERPAGASYKYWLHEEDMDPGYSKEELDFLSGLPTFAVLPDTSFNIFLSHYIKPNLSGYIQGFYSQAEEYGTHFGLMKEFDCMLGFAGHAHVSGFYTVSPDRMKLYTYRRLQLKEFPVVVGIPPVTRHKNRTGFCIFDTKTKLLRVIKLY